MCFLQALFSCRPSMDPDHRHERISQIRPLFHATPSPLFLVSSFALALFLFFFSLFCSLLFCLLFVVPMSHSELLQVAGKLFTVYYGLYFDRLRNTQKCNIFLTDMMKHVETIYYCTSKFSRLFTQFFVKIFFILFGNDRK